MEYITSNQGSNPPPSPFKSRSFSPGYGADVTLVVFFLILFPAVLFPAIFWGNSLLESQIFPRKTLFFGLK